MKTETQVREFKAILEKFDHQDRNMKQWIRTLNWVLTDKKDGDKIE